MIIKIYQYLSKLIGRIIKEIEMVEYIKTNWKDILAIIGGVVSVASVVVKLTPTQKDDTVLDKIISVLVYFSLYNKDGKASK